jgi:bacillopeptidase F (M6 metalloprotease family)
MYVKIQSSMIIKNNFELHYNICKSDKGYDIRIMINGMYKITSIESNLLSDEDLLNKGIKKRYVLIN